MRRLLPLLALAACRPATAAPADRVPVLVELFTSEGCSSCPPADDVLARLEASQPVPGVEIVPVGFHVDYWDGLGWRDPFGASSWTARQKAYAGAIGGGTYTPEAVIDGAAEVIGSRGGALERAIAEAARRPHASVGLDVEPADAGDARVRVTVSSLPARAAEADVVLVLTARSASVDVARGENAGKHLVHTAVARELRVLGPAEAGRSREVVVAAGPDTRVVAFVQERASRRVLGVATRGIVTTWPTRR